MMKSKTTFKKIDTNRFCRFLLEGVIEIPKRCLLNYECRHCGFDQWLEETGAMQGATPAVSVTDSKALAA